MLYGIHRGMSERRLQNVIIGPWPLFPRSLWEAEHSTALFAHFVDTKSSIKGLSSKDGDERNNL